MFSFEVHTTKSSVFRAIFKRDNINTRSLKIQSIIYGKKIADNFLFNWLVINFPN